MYCDESAFAQRFGEKELAELLPEDEGDDGRVYAAAASDADSLIDSYLAGRYAVPLAVVPALIVGLAADLTRHELYDDAPPKEVEARYQRAIELLEQIRDGELDLPGVETLAEADGTGSVAVSARAIAFTEKAADQFMGGL